MIIGTIWGGGGHDAAIKNYKTFSIPSTPPPLIPTTKPPLFPLDGNLPYSLIKTPFPKQTESNQPTSLLTFVSSPRPPAPLLLPRILVFAEGTAFRVH